MLDGVAGDSTVLGYHNLAIDRFQVTVDRARTDHELFGYFSIGKSPGHQAQHLHFSGVSTKVSFENYQPLSIKSFPAIASRRSAVCPKRQWTRCLQSYLCTHSSCGPTLELYHQTIPTNPNHHNGTKERRCIRSRAIFLGFLRLKRVKPCWQGQVRLLTSINQLDACSLATMRATGRTDGGLKE